MASFTMKTLINYQTFQTFRKLCGTCLPYNFQISTRMNLCRPRIMWSKLFARFHHGNRASVLSRYMQSPCRVQKPDWSSCVVRLKSTKTEEASKVTSSDILSAMDRLHRLENHFRYHGYSLIRVTLVIACLGGSAVYLLREPIRENVADEVSNVASRSLEDELVIGKVEQFAKTLLMTITSDESMHKTAAQFVIAVLEREDTRRAAINLAISVLNDPETVQNVTASLEAVVFAAVNDEATLNALKSALANILSDEETRNAVKELLRVVLEQEDIKAMTADFFKEVIRSDAVVMQATQLGKQVTESVVSDPHVQEATGESLWKAVKYSFVPSWFASQTPPSKPASKEPL